MSQLPEIMNEVLTAERLGDALPVETRTKAGQQRIEAEAKVKIKRVASETTAETAAKTSQSLADFRLKQARAEVEALRIRTETEAHSLRDRPRRLKLTRNSRLCCVGNRRGSSVVLTAGAAATHETGHFVFTSANGVWRGDHLPPESLAGPVRRD